MSGSVSLMAVTWEPCEPPLRPTGVVAFGLGAQTLAGMVADRLTAMESSTACDLRISISEADEIVPQSSNGSQRDGSEKSMGQECPIPEVPWIVILGPEEQLPWVDSATYIGPDGGLFRPTTMRSSPAGFLLRRTVELHRSKDLDHSLVVVLPGQILFAASQTQPPQVSTLRSFAKNAFPGDRALGP
jgi:hypothetical protein